MAEVDTSAEAVARMLDGVTPGPWRRGTLESWEGDTGVAFRRVYFPTGTEGEIQEAHVRGDHCDDNAAFIAWSRDAVPALAAERDRLAARLEKAESDCAMFADANARQAMCISFTASNLGPEEYSATVEGLPKAARHVSAERDRLVEENERLREYYHASEAITAIEHEWRRRKAGGDGIMDLRDKLTHAETRLYHARAALGEP